jgi:hypothetical protein
LKKAYELIATFASKSSARNINSTTQSCALDPHTQQSGPAVVSRQLASRF